MHYKINKNLYLNKFTTTKQAPQKQNIDHVIVIDCSGSMYSELPKIRTQLKNKLSSLVAPDDTVTIIWFSGKGQAGILKERVRINNLTDLDNLHKAIDRFLVPMGLTGFVDPLSLVKQIQKTNPISLLFLSDGYDNQYNKKDILKVVDELSNVVDSAVIVEFGYYCNHALMTEMAEKLGGQLIFSEDFDNYEPAFDDFIMFGGKSSKKVEYVTGTSLFGLAFTVLNGKIYTFQTNGSLFVSEDFTQLFTLSETPHGESYENELDLYLPLYVMAQRNKSGVVYEILKELGDVKLINGFTNAFGKQALYNFCDSVAAVIKDNTLAFENGKDKNLVPADDAFCVLDLFEELEKNEVVWYPKHKLFNYKTIGAARTNKIEVSETLLEEKRLLQEKVDKYPSSENLRLLKEKLTEIEENITELKFEYRDENPVAYFSDIVWNENRPNVSFRVKYFGSVTLPKNNYGLSKIDTYKYNNYTFIRDGILNVKSFVTSLPMVLRVKYDALGIVTVSEDGFDVVDLTKLPLINRKMVVEVSAKTLFEKCYELTKLKANAKVLGYYDKQTNTKTSETYDKLYGADASVWLKEIGITDYNGFNPKSVAEKSGESYFANELEVKLDKLSSLPAVEKVVEKSKTGKALTPSETLIQEGIEYYDKHSVLIEKVPTILTTLKKDEVSKKRQVGVDIAKIKFSVLLSQSWFKEFDSMDDCKMIIEVDGKQINCEVVSTEKEIEI